MIESTWKSDPEQTGQNIKKRRKELHMTQEQLAEDMSMSKQAISEYERGVRDMGIQRLYDFADALETTPDALAPDRFHSKALDWHELEKEVSQLDDDQRYLIFEAIKAMTEGFQAQRTAT